MGVVTRQVLAKKGSDELTHAYRHNNRTSYASMRSSGTQAADFIKVLYPTLQAANLSDVGIACCDAEGWSDQAGMLGQLAAVDSYLSTITSHSYTSSPGSPMNTRHPVWQTEAADLNGAWTAAWYASGGAGEGLTWANSIHTAVTTANCSAYLYWIGVQTGSTNSKLVRISDGNGGVVASKRLWAFGQWSRFVRPGAVRVGVSGGGSGLRTSAFQNLDGTVAVQLINTGSSAARAVAVQVGGRGGYQTVNATAFVTDNSHDLDALAVSLSGDDGKATVDVPSRAMVTVLMQQGPRISGPS